MPLYEPCGEGDHTFVWVEKRGRDTEQVVRDLARAAGAAPRDVGYAGRKDRQAVARQWLSVPGLDPDRARGLEGPGWRVLDARRHRHKLRTGQLRANRFEIRLRGVDPEELARARERLADFEGRGFPNRFGAQRFGRDGRGPEQGRALLAGTWRPRDRRAGRFALSALQAAVFNRVLEERPVGLDQLEVGDVAVVRESGGLFEVEDLAREAPRAARFEISATGPIFGAKMRRPGGAPGEREARVLAALGGGDPAGGGGVPGLRLPGARRALRARPEEASLEAAPEGARLRVRLDSGVYATVLLEALFDTGSPQAE